jgi:hypothetical protein
MACKHLAFRQTGATFDEVADHWLRLREADTSIGPNTVRAERKSLAGPDCLADAA